MPLRTLLVGGSGDHDAAWLPKGAACGQYNDADHPKIPDLPTAIEVCLFRKPFPDLPRELKKRPGATNAPPSFASIFDVSHDVAEIGGHRVERTWSHDHFAVPDHRDPFPSRIPKFTWRDRYLSVAIADLDGRLRIDARVSRDTYDRDFRGSREAPQDADAVAPDDAVDVLRGLDFEKLATARSGE
jgi:hypothetical protein